MKQAPCIDDDGEVIVEPLASRLHLVDSHPAAGLAPLPGAPGRAAYMGWMGAKSAVLEPVVVAVTRDEPLDERLSAARAWVDGRIQGALASDPRLLGEGFSAALAGTPAQLDWLARRRASPALARARAKDAAAPG